MFTYEYIEPGSLEEAISFLSKFGGKAKICAGGTDLILRIKQQAIQPHYVVSMGAIPGLDHISYSKNKGLRIGAFTTIRSIETSVKLREHGYAILCQAARQMASAPIRNIATIGGNL